MLEEVGTAALSSRLTGETTVTVKRGARWRREVGRRVAKEAARAVAASGAGGGEQQATEEGEARMRGSRTSSTLACYSAAQLLKASYSMLDSRSVSLQDRCRRVDYPLRGVLNKTSGRPSGVVRCGMAWSPEVGWEGRRTTEEQRKVCVVCRRWAVWPVFCGLWSGLCLDCPKRSATVDGEIGCKVWLAASRANSGIPRYDGHTVRLLSERRGLGALVKGGQCTVIPWHPCSLDRVKNKEGSRACNTPLHAYCRWRGRRVGAVPA